MSHELGRERYVTHRCEKCNRGGFPSGVLLHNETYDEYWCESCIDNEAEAAYERQQAANGKISAFPLGKTSQEVPANEEYDHEKNDHND